MSVHQGDRPKPPLVRRPWPLRKCAACGLVITGPAHYVGGHIYHRMCRPPGRPKGFR